MVGKEWGSLVRGCQGETGAWAGVRNRDHVAPAALQLGNVRSAACDTQRSGTLTASHLACL